ncbi:suppressor of gamma response 1 [Tanacetum coccineum]
MFSKQYAVFRGKRQGLGELMDTWAIRHDHAQDETCDGVAGSALIDWFLMLFLRSYAPRLFLVDRVNQAWTGLPRGVKFDPLDHEIIWHLLTKSGVSGFQPHPFIDEFIPTVEKDDRISYTHLKNLPSFVVVPRGSLFQLNVKANVGFPPDAIYNIVTDPDNKRVFKKIQEVLSRKVLVDEGSRQFATASFDNGAAGDGVDDREKIDQLKGYPNGSSAYITKVELLAAKNLIGAYLNGMSDPRKEGFSNNAIFVHVNYAARMVLGSSNPMSGEEFNFYMDELPVKTIVICSLNPSLAEDEIIDM